VLYIPTVFIGYNELDENKIKHYLINHTELLAGKQNNINGIENFWKQAKRHLRKLNGIPREQFHLYLEESEWRFNHSDSKLQLKLLKQWVKLYLNWLSGSAPNIKYSLPTLKRCDILVFTGSAKEL
jgi:hypothetical protein